jgi:hypothetical protein
MLNPTDGVISWRSITSCVSDSETGLDNWKQLLHEVSTRRCARIDRVVRWVGTKIREPPIFHGLNDLEELLKKNMKKSVRKSEALIPRYFTQGNTCNMVGCTKKQFRTGISVNDYCALDLA